MTREEIIQRIYDKKIIAIVRGLSNEYMPKAAQAMYDGGIELLEVTFQQSAPETWQNTAEAVRMLNREMGGRMLIGTGTVTTMEQVEMAYAAGAKYIISPNVNREVIRRTRELGMVSLPGAMTPTEIAEAYEFGADFVKLFPAGNLGPYYVKAVRAPLSNIPMLAVGGINEKNIAEFMNVGIAGVGVGGNLVNKNWIENGELDKITALAKEYVRAL